MSTPNAVALRSEKTEWQYWALAEYASAMTRALDREGVRPGDVVGVYSDRSPSMIAGILGIMKCGATYLPLDPSYPRERLRFMVDDARPTVIIASGSFVSQVESFGKPVLDLDSLSTEAPSATNHDLRAGNLPAYLMYTTGSSGRPKGVLATHRNTINRLSWMWGAYPFRTGDVCCARTSISFVDSIAEIFGPLLRGVETVLLPTEGQQGIAGEILRALRQDAVSRLVVTPSLLETLLDLGARQSGNTRLGLCISSGEPLPAHLASRFHEAFPSALLLNLYGSTEVAADVAAGEVRRTRRVDVTVGKPIRATTLYVLDRHLQPVPIGVTGELFVGGAGLAQGYWDTPRLTAEKFTCNLFGRRSPGSRLFRTGDVARFHVTGELEVLGRLDRQIKIRGVRTSPQEIEEALYRHPGVARCVVRQSNAPNAAPFLVAYVAVKAASSLDEDELKDFAAQWLPATMLPSNFIFVADMPKLPNGKVDIEVLPEPNLVEDGAQLTPKNAIEECVAQIWSDLLGHTNFGVRDNFFRIGGHSLLASQCVSRIARVFSVDFPLRSFLESPTISSLSRALADTAGAEALSLRYVSVKHGKREVGSFPLSSSQRRFWLLDELHGSLPFHLLYAFQLIGPLRLEVLRRALDEIIRRHEILRTTFSKEGGEPEQTVHASYEIDLRVEDGQVLTLREKLYYSGPGFIPVREIVRADQTPFDVVTGPLMSTALYRLGEDDHILLINLHHIVADGLSVAFIIREMTRLYESMSSGRSSPLPELPAQYFDYVTSEQTYLATAKEILLRYWLRKLAGELPQIELPADLPRPGRRSFNGSTQAMAFPDRIQSMLRSLCRDHAVTLFTIKLACLKMLLHRYSGQTDLIVGTPVSIRGDFEFEELVGPFINNVVLRTDLSEDPSFGTALKRVHTTVNEAFAHRDLPFEALVEKLNPLRDASRNPLFQVELAFQDPPSASLTAAGLELRPLRLENATEEFDLSLNVEDTEGALLVYFEYSTDLFEHSTIARMMGHFMTVAEAAATDPSRRLGELALFSAVELQQLLCEWQTTPDTYPSATSITAVLEHQVEMTPTATAVSWQGEEMTYRDLDLLAGRQALFLRQRGVAREVVVGVCIERSPLLVAWTLAVLKAGGVFLPLDPRYPRERLLIMIEDARPRLVISSKHAEIDLPGHVIGAEEVEAFFSDLAPAETNTTIEPGDAAYIVYTSGSTGRPKGVVVTHGNMLNACHAWDVVYSLRSTTSVHLQTASSSFDVYMGDIVRGLCFGACLVIVPREIILSPDNLYRLMVSQGVDYAEFVPALLRSLVQYMTPNDLSLHFMRLLIVGSDVWYMSEYAEIARFCGPGTRFLNSYGLTEATVDSTWFEHVGPVRARDQPRQVPIGRPFANSEVYVVDNSLRLLPLGAAGELVVGGLGVARGYLNRPKVTARRFVPHPFTDRTGERLYRTGDIVRYRADGHLEYLGRVDRQEKIRGFRIEIGEIEVALKEHPRVGDCAVVVRENGSDRSLAAYVTPAGATPEESDLRSFLKKRLVDYMVPATFTVMNELPLSPNGKVDRNVLPAPDRGSRTYTAPRNPTEESITRAWQRVLGVERAGLEEDFFAIGGHSLLASQLVYEVSKDLEIELPLQVLLENPTIADMAQAAATIAGNASKSALPPKLNLESEVSIELDTPALPARHPAGSILLTGATGFLGAHLLVQLAATTSATIRCLVRAPSAGAGRRRLRETLERYGLLREVDDERILVVPGDFSRPRLGLAAEQYEDLARDCGTVYHCGYQVNFLYTYEKLREANVAGTRRLLELASRSRLKDFYFISSLSVLAGSEAGRLVKEDDALPDPERVRGGYNQCKWVSERMIGEARRHGVPASVFRTGFIGGHGKTGRGNTDDFLWALVKGCLQLGAAPEMSMMVDVLPVDYVAEAIVRISQSGIGKRTFHLFHPQAINWMALAERLRAFGHRLETEPFDVWRRRLFAALDAGEENALVPFASMFREDFADYDEEVPLGCENASAALAGSEVSCPPMNELLQLYFRQLIEVGFLPAVPARHRSKVQALSPFSSASEMVALLRSGGVSARELLDLHLDRIERLGPKINAIVVCNCEEAGSAEDPPRTPLLGLPITVKETIDVGGMPSTAGIPEYAGCRVPEDGLLASRIRNGGGRILGKTNVAYRLQDWQASNPLYGRTDNPWDVSRTAGGSSGGAAAVAAGLTPIDFGSDLIGSICVPAAFCGVYGHRPTSTALPRSGQLTVSEGLHGILPSVQGPMARSAEDLDLALDVACGAEVGEDVGWRLSLPPPRHGELASYRVAIVPEVSTVRVATNVAATLAEIVDLLVDAGAYIDFALPEFGDIHEYWSTGLSLAAVTFHATTSDDDRRTAIERLSATEEPLDRAWARGIGASAADLIAWLAQREIYSAAYRDFFRQWDVLLAPAALCTAYPHRDILGIGSGEGSIDVDGQPVAYMHQALYPLLASLCGQPATVFPAGLSADGLPIGMMAIGPYLEDRTTTRFAALLSQQTIGFRGPPSGFID